VTRSVQKGARLALFKQIMIHAHRKHDMGTAHVVQMHGFHGMREVFTCDTPTCLNDSSVGHKE